MSVEKILFCMMLASGLAAVGFGFFMLKGKPGPRD